MSDLIDRQAAIDVIDKEQKEIDVSDVSAMYAYSKCKTIIKQLPSVLGTSLAEVGTEAISRQAAIDAVNGLIDRFEQILRDIREANVDDSVCGMCEYDGAYIGQSGDWCNECPGFDKDDCFKLSDKTRKKWTEEIIKALPPIQPDIEAIMALPSAQPEIIYCKDCVKHNKGLGNYEVHPDGSGTWIWKDSACPLVSWRDKAQGHEFDYQFCAYAEKREVTT